VTRKGRARLIALASGAAAIGLFLAGCSNDPYPPEGGKKILYAALGEDPRTLDPAQASDVLAGTVIAQMYEALYEYHYLKRPYVLKPALAESMPEVSEDGLTFTVHVKKGVHYHDDPCFTETGGKGREVTADDFIYSIKRLADTANKPTGWWLFDEKVVGLNEFHEEAVKRAERGRPMDYDMPVEGLKALDPYTLQIRLTKRYPQMKYVLAMSYTAAVPREAVEYYGEDFVNHPVGTGPFRLKEWRKRWRMILERNPTYRDDTYPTEGAPGDREAGLLDAAGQRLPIADEVFYTIMYEGQPAWIYFKQGYLDISGVGKDNFDEAVTPDKELSADFSARGIRLQKQHDSDVYYIGFGAQHPILGKNKKLRQAMSLAFDTDWRIEHLYRGQAIPAESPIAPGIFGYDPDFRNPYKRYNPEKARQLLAEAGYPGGFGPDGKQLELTYEIGQAGPAAIQGAEAFVRDMDAIGIKIQMRTNTWAEFLNKAREGRLTLFGLGWILDYPDPENFLQLLYGPSAAPGPNNTLYDNPEFNRLFDQMQAMDDTPERLAIIHKMRDIVVEDAIWIPSVHSVDYILVHQWVRNYKPHGITGGYLKYRDVDVALRSRLRKEWNRPNYGLLAAIVGAVFVCGAVLATFRRGMTRRVA
jgi:oligopeptide transport system substrate-binding protein